MRNLGFIESPLDPRDVIFGAQSPLPEEYRLKNLATVVDQGDDPICAAISLSHILHWQNKAKGVNLKISPYDVFDLRSDKNMPGMVPREALCKLKRQGVNGFKIKSFARIDNVNSAKVAIQMNGPIMICLMAYDKDKFWIPGGVKIGGHAVLLTGWTKEGFILQNSWGFKWGAGGSMVFPEEDFARAFECWTIML